MRCSIKIRLFIFSLLELGLFTHSLVLNMIRIWCWLSLKFFCFFFFRRWFRRGDVPLYAIVITRTLWSWLVDICQLLEVYRLRPKRRRCNKWCALWWLLNVHAEGWSNLKIDRCLFETSACYQCHHLENCPFLAHRLYLNASHKSQNKRRLFP